MRTWVCAWVTILSLQKGAFCFVSCQSTRLNQKLKSMPEGRGVTPERWLPAGPKGKDRAGESKGGVPGVQKWMAEGFPCQRGALGSPMVLEEVRSDGRTHRLPGVFSARASVYTESMAYCLYNWLHGRLNWDSFTRQSARERGRDRDLPSADFTPQVAIIKLGTGPNWSQKLHVSFPCGMQGPKYLGHPLLLS